MPLSGLIVDWGGVLTVGMHEAMGSWAADESIAARAEVGLSLKYQQVSPCTGVFTVRVVDGCSFHQGTNDTDER